MGIQSFLLISLLFFPLFLFRTGATGASIHFCILCKNCYKMQTCNLVALIIGTNEKCVMVDSRTKFTVNLRNIQGVMSIYSRKKDQTSVTATRYIEYRNNLEIGV